MQHYFLKDLIEDKAIFNDEDIHHILHVMRYKNNDKVIGIFDNKKYLISLCINSKNVSGKSEEFLLSDDNVLDITLIYGMPKNDKFELVLQKATELGVKRIVPFLSERSVIKIEEKDFEKKINRWNKILKEASEQSERISIPEIVSPIKINELSNYKSELNLVCDENFARKGGQMITDIISAYKDKSITFLVGPEGGFSTEEFATFFDFGFISVGLGKRILRSETAVIYALSVMSSIIEK